MKTIFCIIVNYKTENIIKKAIESLKENSINLKIIILDNETTKESYKQLQKIIDDRVEIIRSEENLGFAGGCNYAYRYIHNKYLDVNYIFLFNPDAEATENLIGHLFNVMLTDSNMAAISPHIVTMNNDDWFIGTMIDWKNCKIINNPEVKNSNQLRTIDIFNGCAVLMDARKFSEVGMFDDELFLYYDEAFLSMRFMKKGYSIYYMPTVKAYHHVSYSVGENSPFKTYYMTRNHIYFFVKYLKKSSSFLCPHKVPFIKSLYFMKRLDFLNLHANLIALYHTFIQKKGIR
ncbi:MAG TPA: glycosyltransferase family 2 protein [Arcobacter sp.]|nr:glycosyltransferase family 2 protein [Arcobacter sp.]